jgi:hypothetical protein
LFVLCSTYRLIALNALLALYIIFPFYQSGASRVNRNGSVMLTFFPAVGQRKYDYAKKQVSGVYLVFPSDKYWAQTG